MKKREYEKGYWLNEESRTFLSRDYLQPGQTPENRIREIAETAESILGMSGFADKFEDYMLRGWFSLSSPVWSNFGLERGLPCSCNNSFIDDSIDSILTKTAEIGIMSKLGAGTSAYLGKIRPRGEKISGGGNASGPTYYAQLLETTTNIISQSSVRRGSCAVYLDVEHPDIMEFLHIREHGDPIQNLSIGVCISDKWMEDLLNGKKENQKIWAKIIQKRFERGYPYIFFSDIVNRLKPQVYHDKNYTIYSSNLCEEVNLPSRVDESFVCVLSSLNMLHYDDWKDTDAPKILIYFLDAVNEEYIKKIKNIRHMEAAFNFASRHRALGMGFLGWHSYLQSKMIPFESIQAKSLNVQISKNVWDKANEATVELAKLLGEPEVLKGYGRRNTTLMAHAPTTSSSFILGQVSPSIEPQNSNYYIKDLSKGKFTYKNPYLKEVLQKHGKDTDDVWYTILIKGGSVQHLDFLSDHEKSVFKTFGEVSQVEIIIQAVQRQDYIDQGQSINLMIPFDESPKAVSDLLIDSWKRGIKGLYYQRSTSPAQELSRSLMECVSCSA